MTKFKKLFKYSLFALFLSFGVGVTAVYADPLPPKVPVGTVVVLVPGHQTSCCGYVPTHYKAYYPVKKSKCAWMKYHHRYYYDRYYVKNYF